MARDNWIGLAVFLFVIVGLPLLDQLAAYVGRVIQARHDRQVVASAAKGGSDGT